MARYWFTYIKTTPTDRLVSSNYVALVSFPGCSPVNPVNICAIFATLSVTQPVLTANLMGYLTGGGTPPYQNQPVGFPKKYVYTRPQ
ncbi:hypothetical protein ACSBL2_17565 [Pedobacter sp. AW31-3R]|uniref:hypothetical protein n=1 Tax=Pedobacter sp. AW31-3R TaxID=3445781 RepID=UPI003FA15706